MVAAHRQFNWSCHPFTFYRNINIGYGLSVTKCFSPFYSVKPHHWHKAESKAISLHQVFFISLGNTFYHPEKHIVSFDIGSMNPLVLYSSLLNSVLNNLNRSFKLNCPDKSSDWVQNILSTENQNGLTVSHLHTQWGPVTSKLKIYTICIS